MLRTGKGVYVPKFGFFTFLLPDLTLPVIFLLAINFLQRELHNHRCMIKNIVSQHF